MFFQSINQMMSSGVDITLVIRKSAEGRMAVSVLPKSNALKGETQNSIVPLTVSGLPEELDAGFLQTVFRPVQKVSGLIANMEQFEAQAEKAASSGKGTKSKESKEDKEKREKYEKSLKKAQELITAKKHKEAVDALTEARKYANPEEQKKIDEMLEEQKKLMSQGDLFAMMEEPTQPQTQQPVQQPIAAQQQPQTQPATEAPRQAQQPPAQSRPVQQPTQPQGSVPHTEIPEQPAQRPVQQPYGNPGQGYGGQYGYAQPQQSQGWPQQAPQPVQPNGAYQQHPHGGMMPPAEQHYAAYPQNGQAAYPRQPMPFDHEMPEQTIPSCSDDQPSYRPEEYAEYPDFPTSMLQQPQVQPQMI
ncbi:MAG: PRTRC system protein E [Parabacteroides sp.]|nr:PRTRC system protein E [Parabacteroides sp.]